MRTNVRESSLRAYEDVMVNGVGASKRNRIAAWIRSHPRCTRQEIAAGTKFTINCVCGRVDELLKAEIIFERELDKVNPTSGKRVNTLEAVPLQGALDLEAA